MNNDISNVKQVSFSSLASPAQPVKKEQVERAVVDKQDQKKTENDAPDSRVTSLEEAKKLAKKGNMILDSVQRNLQFKVDESTKQVVMSIVDKESGEVIRQLPSEEALALAKRITEADGDPGGIVRDSV